MILAFSTSGPYCGVALWSDGDVIAAQHEDIAKGQAERLMPMIDEVLAEAGASLKVLDALGVGVGPGNFTGIRISVSAARGLALGLGIPSVGVSLLEALAFGHAGPVLTSILAGRDHFCLQRFGKDAARGPEVVARTDVQDWRFPGLTCIGNEEHHIAEQLGATGGPAPFYPASAIARIAAARWQDNPPRPAPLYLRAPDAAPGRDQPPAILS
ncbi:MAG: tRNA (adenosine(37)-N6)-threonylcarbamoyltransferase complex dimerization subunit type 1 TsaB [Sulfitobacter sp.]